MNSSLPKYKFFLVLISTVLLSFVTLAAQESSASFRSELSASYALGAQVYNSNFLFRPGYALSFTHSYKLNKYVNCGLGSGYMQLDDEHFVPFYANLLAIKSKGDVENYIRCNVGYAMAYSKAITRMEDYDLRGGVFFKFGLGHTFPVNEKVALATELSYVYQNARLDYETYNSTTYTESLDYSFFELSIGFVFNYSKDEH